MAPTQLQRPSRKIGGVDLLSVLELYCTVLYCTGWHWMQSSVRAVSAVDLRRRHEWRALISAISGPGGRSAVELCTSWSAAEGCAHNASQLLLPSNQ